MIHIAIDNVIEMLRSEDAKQLAALKRSRPFWRIAAALATFSCVGILLTKMASSQHVDPGFPLRGLVALVFLGLAAAISTRTKYLSSIDYTEPATLFLRKAGKRYQFMSTPYLVLSILIASILALAASVYIVDVFDRYLDIHDVSLGMVSSFTFTAFVYLFGFYVSKKAWKGTRGEMLEEIKKIQGDLRSDPV